MNATTKNKWFIPVVVGLVLLVLPVYGIPVAVVVGGTLWGREGRRTEAKIVLGLAALMALWIAILIAL